MHSRALSLSLLVGLCASACGGLEQESVDVRSDGIYFGEASGEEDDAVVRIRTRPPGNVFSNCTGSLIAANLLLTARHCVSAYVDGVFTCTPDGDLIDDRLGRPGTMGALAEPEDVSVHVGPNPLLNEPPAAIGTQIFVPVEWPTICRDDLALVVLDRDVEAPLLPVRLNTPTLPNELMTAIGYGTTDTGGSGRFRRSDVPVLLVGRSDYWDETSVAPARTFGIGQGPCQGDSGGPSITARGAVAGVFSLNVGACDTSTVRNYYTQLAPYEDLIREAFEAAGAEPILEEPAPAEGGAGGDTGTGGTGGTGALGGTGGTGAIGEGAAPSEAGSPDEPRGSRRGGGCTCTTAGGDARSTALLGALPALLGLALVRRRRRRGVDV